MANLFLFFIMYMYYFVSRYRCLCFAVSKPNVLNGVLNVENPKMCVTHRFKYDADGLLKLRDGRHRLDWYICEWGVFDGVLVVFPELGILTIWFNFAKW